MAIRGDPSQQSILRSECAPSHDGSHLHVRSELGVELRQLALEAVRGAAEALAVDVVLSRRALGGSRSVVLASPGSSRKVLAVACSSRR